MSEVTAVLAHIYAHPYQWAAWVAFVVWLDSW